MRAMRCDCSLWLRFAIEFRLFASITLDHKFNIGRSFGENRFPMNWRHKPAEHVLSTVVWGL